MNVRAFVLRTYATITGLLSVVALIGRRLPASGDSAGSEASEITGHSVSAITPLCLDSLLPVFFDIGLNRFACHEKMRRDGISYSEAAFDHCGHSV